MYAYKKQNPFLRRLFAVSQTAAMADIALLLLIFFMVTTTTDMPDEPGIVLPQAETEGAEPNSYYITITPDGRLFWFHDQITLEILSKKLIENRFDIEKKVVVFAHKDLPYSIISQVLDVLKVHEFRNVMLLSEPLEASP